MQGCATIFNGSTEAIKIDSAPTDAAVKINGDSKGKTPIIVDLPKDSNYRVEISKIGFNIVETEITSSTNYWWLIADLPLIVFGPFGLITIGADIYTGNMYKLDPKEISVTLYKNNNSLSPPNYSDSIKSSDQIVIRKLFQFELQRKSPFLAFVLSSSMPTAGHLYSGDWVRGLPFGIIRTAGILIAASKTYEVKEKTIQGSLGQSITVDDKKLGMLFWAGLAIYSIFSIWEGIDAASTATEYNQRLINNLLSTSASISNINIVNRNYSLFFKCEI